MSVLAAVLLGHGLLVAATTALISRARPGRRVLAWQAVAMGAAFPVVGPLSAWWLLGRSDASAVWRDDLPAAAGPEPASVDPQKALARELAVHPLADRLRTGPRDGRQAAAQALAELGDARAVRLLEQAVLADDADTRLFASIALVRLESTHAANLTRTRAARDPLTLARAIRHYLASGLPRGAVAQELWRELERAAGSVIARRGRGVAEAYTHLAAARRALGDLDGSCEAASQALALAPLPSAALELCETLWAAGDLAALRAAAARLAELVPPGSPAHQAASYWVRP